MCNTLSRELIFLKSGNFEELMILKIKIAKCWICDTPGIYIPQKFRGGWIENNFKIFHMSH